MSRIFFIILIFISFHSNSRDYRSVLNTSGGSKTLKSLPWVSQCMKQILLIFFSLQKLLSLIVFIFIFGVVRINFVKNINGFRHTKHFPIANKISHNLP